MAHAEQHSHKDMGGRPIDKAVLERYLAINRLEIFFDPETQGGFVYNQDGAPVAYVRSPYWRQEQNDPKLHKDDLRPVFIKAKPSIGPKVDSGAELEMYVFDPQSEDMAPIMGPDSDLTQVLKNLNGNGGFVFENEPLFEALEPKARKIGFSAELAQACIELNMHHSPDPKITGLAMLKALKTLAKLAEKQGQLLSPIAAFSHRALEKEDTHPHPYIQRIAMGFMGWENVRHFVGASWQIHVEMLGLESALPAINLYQQVSALLYAISLAGPFLHGQTNPNLSSIYGEDETSAERLADSETNASLNHSDWLSIRYPSRYRGSPSGGTFTEPLPENVPEFIKQAEAMLQNNDHHEDNIPNPGRVAGQHRDRVRIDIGPYGTLEISNMDTFGGHINKLVASQEFTKALIWKLQLYAKTGKLAELTQNYPRLFQHPVTPESLRAAHLASIEVAKNGAEGIIKTQNGEECTVQELFLELLAFVNEPIVDQGLNIDYQGLPKGIEREIKASIEVPTLETFEEFRDQQGVVSVQGYYDTGIGTLAHWLKQRAQDLIKIAGLTQEEAIKNCLRDLGLAYHCHLGKTQAEDIVKLLQ